ncbi:MAG: amidohydrolase [Oscillospiraceae bacterium]|nr:amidohydrolase [Oscillospiraceae bacterium]
MQHIIDCHCHVYPDKIAEKAAEATGKFYSLPMEYNGTIGTVFEEAKKSGVSHCVIFSVATKPSQVRSINEFIAATVAKSPEFFTGLGALHPDSEDIEGDIEHLMSLGLKGGKLHPDIQAFEIDNEKSMKICSICEEKGLPVLFHTGDRRYDYSNPNRLKPVLQAHPNLTVIAAHLGGWSVWEDAVKELAHFKNLYVDCSSSLAFMPLERITEIIKTFGAEKVLFGTDYPMWNISDELDRFSRLGLSDEERELILCKNAQKLFGIKLNCVENNG